MKCGVRRRLSSRSKNLTAYGRRFSDTEFNKLNQLLRLEEERYCGPSGLNRHGNLPLSSKKDSLYDRDVSGQSINCNPPWLPAIECVEHLRACHSKLQLETEANIALSECRPKFKVFTIELN
jgi:hypothetical protein